ncbi:lysine transporter LysE [Sulfitobacter alexandrii]|uniref:Lysine transporter LysE n=1 Tax=Sulfitobacter alexandrii TaxID=1917485 RepID=A0A1J0WHG5_9RHOB|nr:LysE family transporter [Sulfitobacter alexandrii]APE43773.1 lysine transporter LysE [Sulfitobacter alexandrii]
MTPESLAAFNLLLLAALASPGAAMLFVIKTTVSAGRLAGFLSGIGLALAAGGWTAAAFLGLDRLLALAPWAYVTLKVAGALYLMWIALQTWRHARTPPDDAGPLRAGRNLLAGALVNLGNPKSMLFAAALILVVFPRDLGAAEIALVVVNHVTLEILFYGLFALLLSAPPARRGYLRLKPVFDRIAAILLGAFGLRLLIER